MPDDDDLWHVLGVYCSPGVTHGNVVSIDIRDVKGKAAIVGEYIVTIPRAYLKETTD